jgi:hypothetical protein
MWGTNLFVWRQIWKGRNLVPSEFISISLYFNGVGMAMATPVIARSLRERKGWAKLRAIM